MHFADLALFTTIVSLLSTVNIVKALDDKGDEINVKVETSGQAIKYVLLT